MARRSRLWLLVADVACCCAVSAATAGAAVQPYGTNDAGGFRNVLPPGTKGTDNAVQLAQYQSNGQRPQHWIDQLPLYVNLVYADPTLTHGQIGKYFKDATFGVKPDQVERIETPRPGVTIVRDKAFGVPHIYGAMRDDVMFGTGYAGAEDRLFLMDVLRHTGRAQLSSFAGGAASNRQMDRDQWQAAPYTEADLQKQIDDAPKYYGSLGTRFVQDGDQYVAGINQYIHEATNPLDPVGSLNKLPGEYAALGKVPQPWKLTDVIATASLIGGIFGKGGGEEVRSARILQSFLARFGSRRGRRSWLDFRERDDPESPVTAHGSFPYETANPFSKRGLAIPDPGSVSFSSPGPPITGAARTAAFGLDMPRALLSKQGHSNVLLVSAKHSATHHPIAVMGPQVGYYVPQILMEEDLHGPGIDADGAAFPGVNLYVQLGHGRDYAWSATSANSDDVDTFAEVLCKDDYHYLWHGQCLPMEQLSQQNSWTPNALDQSPPGSETLTVYRTVHGIVYARGTVHGKKVAYARARTTYFHEADSALGFKELNDPGFVRDAKSFQRAASSINFSFNWFYIDSRDIAYYVSGWYPRRAAHTSPSFPVLGTGQYDWAGYSPSSHLAKWVGFKAHPHAINQRYFVSWNNHQARHWNAADDNYHYERVFRSQLLEDKIKTAIRGGRRMPLQRLVQAMEETATQDMRGVLVLPTVLRVMGHPKNARLRKAMALLRRWVRRGAHRRDLNRDGHYDDDNAVTLMDAWWPRLVAAEFRPALGAGAYDSLAAFEPPDAQQVGTVASSPDYETGWYGYVTRDLRDLFGPRGRTRWSRIYCGTGRRDGASTNAKTRARCRAALRRSLLAATHITRQDLYGHDPTCSQEHRVEASCYDE
ncbi:MAG: penicillin acylase family protein, partial [Actinobacteria bacterium]|nr:penicillin acylase family protein [Actinomycetota bacterium]